MIECPNCEKTSSGSSCRLCGWSVAASSPPKPKPAEGYAAWQAPTYPAQQPGDEDLIRAEMAKVNALLGITPEDLAAPVSRLPSVNPEIRALIDAKMGEMKGAPR